MVIYAAVINHKHGSNLELALTDVELQAQIYVYVKDNWSELDTEDPLPEKHTEAIETYFELEEGEYVDLHLTTLGAPSTTEITAIKAMLERVSFALTDEPPGSELRELGEAAGKLYSDIF